MSSNNDLDIIFGSDDEDDSENENEIETSDQSQFNKIGEKCNRPDDCGVMAFHNGTEEALFCHLDKSKASFAINTNCAGRRGTVNVSKLLTEIDHFCYNRHWMMHIGDQVR